MPKDTFRNLNPEKKERIIEVLKNVFQEKPIQEVTVKEIVEELGIARGSFYQYFEDIEDACFEMLNTEVVDIHKAFVNVFQFQYQDLAQALYNYGEILSDVLFDKDSYLIYRNIYLFWDESLNQRWMKVHDYYSQLLTKGEESHGLDIEQIHYLKGIIHTLIKRNYKECWTKEQFIKKYRQNVGWIIEGVN